MELFNWIAGAICTIIFLLFIYYYGFEMLILLCTADTTPESREQMLKKLDKKPVNDTNIDMPFDNLAEDNE